MVLSAAMGALALALPVAFHAAGLGSRFLPMLLPLLVNGYLSRWPWAVATGFCIPWISAFATGMPPLYPPIAAIMSAEGAVLAAAAAATPVRFIGIGEAVDDLQPFDAEAFADALIGE